jgi:hypothetical protein
MNHSVWRRTAWALLLIVALYAADAWMRSATWVDKSTRLVSSVAGGVVEAGDGRDRGRTLFLDADSLYWIDYARRAVRERSFRVRHTRLDNAPHGREVHWSSPPVWLLLGLAACVRATSGATLPDALVTAGPWLNVAPYLLGALGFARFAAGRTRTWPTLLAAAGFAGIIAFRKELAFGRLDHHGLLLLAILGSLLFLAQAGGGVLRCACGEDSQAALRRAHRSMLLSGIAGGVAFWIQAPFAAVTIFSAALGFTFWVWAFTGTDAASRMAGSGPGLPCPDLWRRWGLAGAATSALAYLLEYAPGNMGMRLEVNHPLYAVAWLGLAEISAVYARRVLKPEKGTVLRLALPVLAVMALPLAIWKGPDEWFVLRDPFLRRIHLVIGEFAPLPQVFAHGTAWKILLFFSTFTLAIPAAIALLCSRAVRRPDLSTVCVLLAPALATFALAWQHNRFSGLHAAILLVLAVAVCAAWEDSAYRREVRRIGDAVCALLTAAVVALFANEMGIQSKYLFRAVVHPALEEAIICRDVARELGQNLDGQAVVISGFETPYWQHFGGLRGTGSLYWENLDGLRDTAAFLTDPGERDAARIARARGIEYVIVRDRSSWLAEWLFAARGSARPEDIAATLAGRLLSSRDHPKWLKAVPPTRLPLAHRAGFRVFAVDRSRL